MSTAVPGRRERKKAATRQALADAALELFLARGFDAVTVAEVADAADVSVTTLFKHFRSKEALLFDEDTAHEDDLVGAVRDREPGTGVLDALYAYMAARVTGPPPRLGRAEAPTAAEMRRFGELIDSTPALREYRRQMWARHEDALAAALAADRGAAEPAPDLRALAHVVVNLPPLMRRGEVDPITQLDVMFAILRNGWSEYRPS